ncbi:hypothetical protein [Microbacterium phyllosphaerae]|uniref:hypothetical protein n=1 Tax=Microbacterium phyllosphaerae TaxID=124798 RepID=UPI00142DA5AD
MVSGTFNAFNGTPTPGIARVTPSGTITTVAGTALTAPGTVVESIAEGPEDSLYIGGLFTVDGATAGNFARLS